MNIFYWIIVVVIFSVIEAVTVRLISVWFAAGALLAIIPAALGASTEIQIIVFLASSIVLFAATSPFTKKFMQKKQIKTNAGSIIGMTGLVIEDINNIKGEGRVLVNNMNWWAQSADDVIIEKNSLVLIKEISGAKVIVEQI